jgi:hypothetical protein
LEGVRRNKFGQKSVIAQEVVEWIKKNCWFLKQSKDGWWIAVGNEEVLEKVSQLFRTRRLTSSKTSYTMEVENRKRVKMLQENKLLAVAVYPVQWRKVQATRAQLLHLMTEETIEDYCLKYHYRSIFY